MADGHVTEKKLEKLHKNVGGTEDGACLTGHLGRYQEMSCSYRWQAHKVSEERKTIYNDKAKGPAIKSGAFLTDKNKVFPSYISVDMNPRVLRDSWDVNGPSAPFKPYKNSKKEVPVHANFTRAYWPYWHNAHHIIPKGMFNSVIEAKQNCQLIKQSLLKALYNINHKINMIILPQGKDVARALGLPRHLILREKSRKELFDHPAYSALVESGLKPIINQYDKSCDQARKEAEGKPHAVPDVELSKAQLERLSKQCYKAILAFGKTKPGAPIDDIPSL